MTRSRQKTCNLCAQTALLLYRIKHDASGTWAFVCSNCWNAVSQDNPLYVYGGTWKAKKG